MTRLNLGDDDPPVGFAPAPPPGEPGEWVPSEVPFVQRPTRAGLLPGDTKPGGAAAEFDLMSHGSGSLIHNTGAGGDYGGPHDEGGIVAGECTAPRERAKAIPRKPPREGTGRLSRLPLVYPPAPAGCPGTFILDPHVGGGARARPNEQRATGVNEAPGI